MLIVIICRDVHTVAELLRNNTGQAIALQVTDLSASQRKEASVSPLVTSWCTTFNSSLQTYPPVIMH